MVSADIVIMVMCVCVCVKENEVVSADSAMLSKQKQLVMDRLREFEEGNRELRTLLHQRHEEDAASLRLMEQRDLLLRKLSEADISGQVRV